MDQNMALHQEGTFTNSQDFSEASGFSATSLELLEQHQAKEQARLLQRFKELREWQQQQQLQLMLQQKEQLSTLQKEQSKVQSLHAAKQHNGTRAVRPNAARSMSPIMTPPCKPRPVGKVGNQEPVGNSMTAGISVDSGLVSMQDTLKSQMSTLPKPVMYIDPSKSNNVPDEDKYTNSDLFSNPGCRDDVDDEFDNMIAAGKNNKNNNGGGAPMPDWMSDTSEFVPPKLPPPRPMRGGIGAQNVGVKLGRDISTADQLAGLEQLLTTAPAGLLQKMLTLLPKTTDSISSDAPPMKRIVENSASPTLTGPIKPSIQQQMKVLHQNGHGQLNIQAQHLQQLQQQQQQQPLQWYDEENNAQDLNQPQHLRDIGSYNVTTQDLIQMPYLDKNQIQDSQYVPRAVYLNESAGFHRPPDDDDDVEEEVGAGEYEDDEEEDDLEEFDEEDQEDVNNESHNNTAREVNVAEDGDDRPIGGTGGVKSFEKLLEEKLRQEEEEKEKLIQMQNDAENNRANQPRKFLRKGEGIARFNSAPKKPTKPPIKCQEKRTSGGGGRGGESDSVVKAHNIATLTEKGKSTIGSNSQSKEKASVGSRLKSMASRKVSVKDGKYNNKTADPNISESKAPSSPPAKLTLIRNAASRKLDEHRSRQKEECYDVHLNGNGMMNGTLEKRPKGLNHCTDQAVDQSPSSKSTDDHDSTELDSLAEFELLEDVADNMSFCSNSSIVRKLVCSDAKDHKDAVKKLHAITEGRKQQREGKAPPLPPSMSQLTNGKTLLNSMTDRQENLGPNPLQNANSNNSNANVGINTNNNFHNPFQGDSHTSKSSKIDNIIMAKPTDHCSSSDVTLTESSSSEEDIDEIAVESSSNKFGHQNDGIANFNKNPFSSGFFHQRNEQHCDEQNIFSSQHSEFTQDQLLSSNSAKPDFTPNKPITRKVASLTSKVNSANDTLAMLQALSKKAGFLVADPNGKHVSSENKVYNSNDLQGQMFSLKSLESDVSEKVSLNTMSNEAYPGFNGQLRENMEGQNSTEKEYNSGNYGVDDVDNENGDGFDTVDNNHGFRMDKSEKIPLENGTHQEMMENRPLTERNPVFTTNCFDDEAEWTDGEDDDDDDGEDNPLSHRLKPTTTMTTVGFETAVQPPETPPTSKLVSKLFPKLKPPVTKQINAPSNSNDSCLPNQGQSQTAVPSVDGITSRVLRDKLMELEKEIERFRSENSNLDRLRREREEGLAKLKQQIETFEREKESELKRLEEFKMEETKKLRRERKLFDSYQKKVRSMPDKKEREEIENLKGQLEEAQDELRRKESRWNSSMSRLKNRLAEVELENGELKEEVRILEKKRLEWLAAQSQAKTSSSSLISKSSAVDVKTQSQDQIPSSSQPRSSTPTKDNKPAVALSTQGKKPVSITLRTSVPAVTASTNAPKTSKQPKVASSKALKPHDGKSEGTSDLATAPSSALPTSQPTLRTSGESLPTQNNLVPVMMETTPFAQIIQNGQRVPPSTALGTLSSASSSSSPHDNKSAAMQAMEKAVIEKGNPMDFVENVHSDGKVEKMYKNGAKEVRFPNGTIKEITADGQTIVCRLANGDIRQIFPDHRVVYIFSEAQIMQTTFPDGLETFQFKNGQVERRYPDGTVEITFPSKDVKYIFPDGGQEVRLTDGTIMTYNNQGERTVEYPSGDREVHTAEYQRREFPDGIVKTVYADGRHETRFPNGRVRMRDKAGNVIMDQMCYR